ncbi:MAG TPA: DUF2892 domain-containing protein [Rhodoglobus sp.]|nr:DUF2892 domain-containing protein [Rhodoglobus sp.]
MAIIKFLGSTAGRWTRGIAGLALLGIGVALGGWWLILAAVGLVVFLAGALDFCIFAPLAGRPFNGRRLRASF